MTKPQIWVAAVLVFFFLLLVLEMNTNRSDEQKKSIPPGQQSQMAESSKPQTPEQLVSSLGCTGCHGADLSGTRMAPDLHNVKDYWSRDKLINFLRNPSSYMSSDRFQNFKARYPNVMMPSFSNINVQELGRIADYLLKLKK